MAFTLHVHPEAQPWVPEASDLERMRSFFRFNDMRAHLLPRRMANQVLGMKKKPYAFRAFTRGNDSYVFVDPTETKKSTAWILSHELAHQMVDRTPVLEQAFDDATVHGPDRAGDHFHEVDPEERFADGIATRLIGPRLDRTWWRERTKDPRLIDRRIIDRRVIDSRSSP